MKIYNTLNRQVEEFIPLTPGRVNMYVCGPTVYNYFHIGNARPFVVFDTIRNYLKYKGYKVTFVQNVTDVDDKIINKAKDDGTTWDVIAKKYTDAYFEDLKRLKVEMPDISPRATGEIDKMIEIIRTLVDKAYAYASKNGVYYSVEKFAGYGKLSHKKIDELIEGARVDVDEQKRSPLDFALWKFSKPGEPEWDSPWGKGRPGWHIECSAMASKYLGDTFDIHGGGNDLIFPHHENEKAQSEAASGKPFAKYWMHNGFMNIKGEKMSKSIGNIVLAREILDQYPVEAVRMFLLSAHYRGPIDFTKETIDAIKEGYRGIYYTLQRITQAAGPAEGNAKETELIRKYMGNFEQALDEDFNTPKALAAIFSAVEEAKITLQSKRVDEKTNKTVESGLIPEEIETLKQLRDAIVKMCKVLKLDIEIPVPGQDIIKKVEEIGKLREKKQYAEADALKKEAAAEGYILEFTKFKTFIIKELK